LENSAAPHRFEFRRLDDSPELLAASYGLRYEVYCLERSFLQDADYPSKSEQDEYDSCSMHFGAFDRAGDIVGTVRMVMPPDGRFPLFDHCIVDREQHLLQHRTVEISRLAISRQYRRRAGDDALGISPDMLDDQQDMLHRRRRPELVMGLYKAMYQESKRQGIECWLAAMERSLQRLLARYSFFFQVMGPEVDYYGPVTPYIARISEVEGSVRRNCPSVFAEFQAGL
jgi:N-acyl amino acid synthase of PEP-CTERM/exosortase system